LIFYINRKGQSQFLWTQINDQFSMINAIGLKELKNEGIKELINSGDLMKQ